MAQSWTEQYDIAANAIATGDIHLLAKVMKQPGAVTIDEQRTVAEKLGFTGGFLSAAINTAADPLVWIAAFMSRKFPTQAWLKGTVPNRFIGTSNEFSGLSLMARPSEAFFRGTNMANLNSLSQTRMATVLKVAKDRIFPHMDRPKWADEMPIVSQLLEGARPAGATPELQKVADNIRGGMQEMWGFLRRTQRVEGGLDQGTFATARDFTAAEAPKFLRDYLPHIPLQGNESQFIISAREAIEKLGGARNRSMRQMLDVAGGDGAIARVSDVWTATRQDNLVSEYARWQSWVQNVGAQVYNSHLFRRVRHGLTLHTPKGAEAFYTDLNLVLQKYVTSVGRTFALNAPLTAKERLMTAVRSESLPGGFRIPTSEPVIVQMINQGLEASGIPRRQRTIPGTRRVVESVSPGAGSAPSLQALRVYIRSVRGSASDDEMLWAPLFNRVYDKINSLRGKITGQQVAQLTDGVAGLQGSDDYRRITNGMTNYLYTTTLGLNPVSAMKNLFQNVITTAPALGIGPTIAGMREFAPKVRAFAGSLTAQMRQLPSNQKGVRRMIRAANKSFEQHFPELVSQRLDIDPRLFDINESELQRMVGPTGKFRSLDDFGKLLMAPFTSTEIANRAITFYGAKHALRNAHRTGEFPLPKLPDGRAMSRIEHDEFLNFEAAGIVNALQFRPGPGQRTPLQAALPPPLRQFSTFPIRLGNFFAESTVRGAMTAAQLSEAGVLSKLTGGRNLGAVARTFLFGKIAANGMRDVLGVDIGDAVGITSVFPFVPDDQPFAPLPMPPLPSAMFGIMSAFASRDMKKLHPLELPGGRRIPIPKTLFPGGIAASRMFRALNQWRPDMGGFVDEDERLMFKGDTPDLILQTLGIPLDKLSRERRDMERLHANRRVLRDFGRKFRLAASNYDFKRMDRLRRDYKEVFPDMPELTVSERDLDLYEQGRRRTRVERMLQTMPAAFRTLERDIYSVDPGVLEPAALLGQN